MLLFGTGWQLPPLLKYIIHRKWVVLLITYLITSSMLYIFTNFNITLPCVWSSVFNIHCYGCGLTRAFISLLKFDWVSAWTYNPLIFVILPTILLYTVLDFRRVSS